MIISNKREKQKLTYQTKQNINEHIRQQRNRNYYISQKQNRNEHIRQKQNKKMNISDQIKE